MLPVTSAPAAETLPSVTVSVERVDGSQLPVLVTTVTCQSPSYGVWAPAGTAERAAAAVRAEARKAMRMRSWRINQIPDLRDVAGPYSGTMCSKFAAPRHGKKFLVDETFDVNSGSRTGTYLRVGASGWATL